MCPDFSHVKSVTIPQGSVKRIEQDGRVLWRKEQPEPGGMLTFTALSASRIYLQNMYNTPNCEYSYDEITWATMPTLQSSAIQITAGQSIKVRGNNPSGFSISLSTYSSFVMTGKISASGSVMSLIDQKGETKVIPNDWCFSKLFNKCGILTTAPEVPATTLMPHCYYAMFQMCGSLTTAPELPATTLVDNCYQDMFRSSSSLKVNQNGAGTKIFTCPSTSGLTNPVNNMFGSTGGTFKDTPTTGNTYNWYE